MAQNLTLDPMKRDYVVVNGSPVPTNRVEEKTYFALTIPQGKWLYGEENQGSLLWTIQQKRSSTVDQTYASFARAAVQAQVLDVGDATNLNVRNLEATKTGTLNQIDVTPSQVQVSDQFDFVPV